MVQPAYRRLVTEDKMQTANDAAVAANLDNEASATHASAVTLASTVAHEEFDATVSNKVDKGDIVVNAADYGSIGDGTAIVQALAALGTNRGTVLIPPGLWTLSQTLVINSGTALRGDIRGAPGKTTVDGNRGTRIQYTGTGNALDLSQSQSWLIGDLAIEYTNPAATAPIVDATDHCSLGTFERVYLGSSDPANNQSAPCLVDMDGTANIAFRDCRFYGAQTLISGTGAAWGFANAITFDNCFFNKYATAAITNPDKAWAFNGSSFEPNTSGAGVALICESGHVGSGVSFNDCWAGDNTAAGDWIQWRGAGLVIDGGAWALGTGTGLVKVLEDSVGISLGAVVLRGSGGYAVDLNGTATTGVAMLSVDPTGQLLKGNDYGTGALVQDPNNIWISGKLRHIGDYAGFFGTTPVQRPSVPTAGTVTADDLRAALISLGLVQ